jgi:hypothetical protein
MTEGDAAKEPGCPRFLFTNFLENRATFFFPGQYE